MPKRSQTGHSKPVNRHQQQNQQNELRRAKEASLQQFLKERNLYRPGMKTKEMQQLCSEAEQSDLDKALHQQCIRFNESFAEEPTTSTIRPTQGQSESYKNVNDTSRQALSNSQFYSVTSPEKARKTVCRETDDSDSDEIYSPEHPGPCCRQIHVVKVEIHPEPRAYDDQEELEQNQASVRRITSPRSRKALPAIEWDSIDEI